jgi:tRNA (adenine22-N1)-methyltransferase
LIVQPNHGFPRLGSLRTTMSELGWTLIDEVIVRDQTRMYVVLVAEPGEPCELDDVDRELGPILRRGGDPLYATWLARERRRIEKACDALARAGREPDKLAQYRGYLAVLSGAVDGLCVPTSQR